MKVLSALSGGLLAAAVISSEAIRRGLPLQVSGHQDTLYSAVAGVGATLLGFLIAAIALLAVLPPENLVVRRLRTQGLLRRAVNEISQASFAMAAFMSAGLVGLVVDQPPALPIRVGAHLGTGAYWVWTVALTALPAAVLLISSMAAVARAVRWVTDSTEAG